MHQIVAIQSGKNVRGVLINGSLLAVDEDIRDGIHPLQTHPMCNYNTAAQLPVMVCHPAALRKVMQTLEEGDNRMQYTPLPSTVKGMDTIIFTLREFSSYVVK